MKLMLVHLLIFLIAIAVTQGQDASIAPQTSPSFSWEKEPLDFRGVPWGSSESEVKKKLGKLHCSEFENSRYCSGDFNISNIKVRNFFDFHNDKLVSAYSGPTRPAFRSDPGHRSGA